MIPPMLRVDFHTHTYASPDSLAQPADLLRAMQRQGLDRIAITDHNTLRGARQANELDPEHFIVGEEILTTAGELLAVYVKEEIPKRLPPMEALTRLKEQDAFISVSHPFDRSRNGAWKLPDLLAILPYIDSIEVFNARCMLPNANQLAKDFAEQHRLAVTAGSDAHAPFELGAARLYLPEFHDAPSLRQAVRQAQVEGRMSPGWVHFVSFFARLRQERAREKG